MSLTFEQQWNAAKEQAEQNKMNKFGVGIFRSEKIDEYYTEAAELLAQSIREEYEKEIIRIRESNSVAMKIMAYDISEKGQEIEWLKGEIQILKSGSL